MTDILGVIIAVSNLFAIPNCHSKFCKPTFCQNFRGTFMENIPLVENRALH